MRYSGQRNTFMWIIKIKCFSPRRMLEKNWCIYSCLHNSPERTGFNIYIWEYATVINFPCLITLQGCLKKDSIDLCQKAHPLWNCLTIIFFFFLMVCFYPTMMSKRDKYFWNITWKFSLILRMTFFWRPETL